MLDPLGLCWTRRMAASSWPIAPLFRCDRCLVIALGVGPKTGKLLLQVPANARLPQIHDSNSVKWLQEMDRTCCLPLHWAQNKFGRLVGRPTDLQMSSFTH